MQIFEGKVNGEWFKVEYEVFGKHRPATYYEPEEWPEIIIHSIEDEDGEEYDENRDWFDEFCEVLSKEA